SPVPGQLPWDDVGDGAPELSRLLCAMLAWRQPLLTMYPTTPVPAELPTPVAALLLVWERWDLASGACPRCGAPALATSFGGLLSTGAVRGTCTVCAALVGRWVGGLVRVMSGCR